MCGIIGYTGPSQAAPILLDGLRRLEYRGYDSAGIAVLQNGALTVEKITGRIEGLSKKTENGTAVRGHVGIGHTRWATHGAPTDENAHPHKSNDGRFAVVHNGIIENYQALRTELTQKGYVFTSETDTEVVSHLIEMYDEGDAKNAVIRAAARLRGSFALGVLCTDSPDTVYVAREASPLILGVGVGESFFASDVTALVPHTRNVIYLEDGEFAAVSPAGITVFDGTGATVEKKPSRITWDVAAAERGGYEHFMLKEIMEQPRAVEATISPRLREGEVCFEGLFLDEAVLRDVHKIVITACGSAYYAGCAGKIAIERLCRIPVSVELASELRYADPLIDRHTLAVVLSQSGETADTIAALKECRARGARTLAVVNVVGSTVASLADGVIYTWAGPEIAVATTKGYTTQLAALYLLATYIAGKTGSVDKERYAACVRALSEMPKRIQEVMDMNAAALPRLAEKYGTAPSAFYIGRGTDHAAALEGALKMKEISYVHAEAYAAGELKHGTIALVEQGTPVVALACNGEVTEKTVSNIQECKARGARVLGVSFRDDTRVSAQVDDVILIPQTEPLFAPLLQLPPLQTLAYYVARARGCDIDKPKNLAKSVTVE